MVNFFKVIGKIILWLVAAVVVVIALALLVVGVRYWIWTPDPLDDLYGDHEVLNFAHRGAREAAPENTISAFLTAEIMGAHGVELDVMFSQDKELVVIHDWELDRTTDGAGLVRDYTMDAIRELDAGSWFREGFTGERIPTLQEVVEILEPETMINIELKSVSPVTDGLEAAVVDVIQTYDLYGRVVVSSFNPIALLRVKQADKDIPVGLLYNENEKMLDNPALDHILRKGWFISILRPEQLHPHFDMVDEKYMEWARKKGFRVNAWTVNEAADLKRMLDLGVDGIITDRPDQLLKHMEERGLVD